MKVSIRTFISFLIAFATQFKYKGNRYNRFYLYSKNEQLNNGNYEKCLSYISNNNIYERVSFDGDRQVRLHTCFPYCR